MKTLQKINLKTYKIVIYITENTRLQFWKKQRDTRKLRQFNELRNKINEQKEYFTKEIWTTK